VHKVGNKIECNNVHGERIKIIDIDVNLFPLNLKFLLFHFLVCSYGFVRH